MCLPVVGIAAALWHIWYDCMCPNVWVTLFLQLGWWQSQSLSVQLYRKLSVWLVLYIVIENAPVQTVSATVLLGSYVCPALHLYWSLFLHDSCTVICAFACLHLFLPWQRRGFIRKLLFRVLVHLLIVFVTSISGNTLKQCVLLLQFFNSREDEEDCLLFPIVEYIKVGFGARVCVSESIANRDMLISRYVRCQL